MKQVKRSTACAVNTLSSPLSWHEAPGSTLVNIQLIELVCILTGSTVTYVCVCVSVCPYVCA